MIKIYNESSITVNALIQDGLISETKALILEQTLGISNLDRSNPFYFVGLIEVDNQVIISAPKIYDSYEPDEFKLLLSLFSKLSKTKSKSKKPLDSDLFDSEKNTGVTSRVGIAEFLISDFLTNGTLKLKKKQLKKDDFRNINWEKTISKNAPLISNNNLVYDTIYSTVANTNNESLISAIHEKIVQDCLMIYGNILGYKSSLLNANSINLPGNVIPILKKHLRVTYTNRETEILKLLLRWIENEPRNGISFYGTRYFHTVWELVCSDFFQNRKDDKIWDDVMPAPKWFNFSSADNYFSSGKFNVDIISDFPEKSSESGIFLIDAKYYNPKFIKTDGNKVIDGLPIADISKQIHYERLIQTSSNFVSKFSETEGEIVNIFLFPKKIDSLYQTFAKVSIDRITINPILCVHLSADGVIGRYIKNRPITELEKLNIILDVKALIS